MQILSKTWSLVKFFYNSGKIIVLNTEIEEAAGNLTLNVQKKTQILQFIIIFIIFWKWQIQKVLISYNSKEKEVEKLKKTTEKDHIHLPAAAHQWAVQVALLLDKNRIITEEKNQKKMLKSEWVKENLIQQLIDWMTLDYIYEPN